MVSRNLADTKPAFMWVKLWFKVTSVPPENTIFERTYLPRKFAESWKGRVRKSVAGRKDGLVLDLRWKNVILK